MMLQAVDATLTDARRYADKAPAVDSPTAPRARTSGAAPRFRSEARFRRSRTFACGRFASQDGLPTTLHGRVAEAHAPARSAGLHRQHSRVRRPYTATDAASA